MDDDTAFEPRLGRIRSRGGARGRAYLARVLAASNLARGSGPSRAAKRGGAGPRARAAGTGRALLRRDAHAAFRRRRVVIKTRIVKLAGKGAAGAAAHLRYLQRDGATRGQDEGQLYGASQDRVDGRAFLRRGAGDRHQFRLIVAPEDGAQYDDLKPLIRRLMSRAEEDLGTRLDWAAVDHFDTGHPHSHVVVRGKDDDGRDLVIARDYLTHGLRERAAELVDLDLGPRSDRDIEAARRAEMTLERLTSIDRALLRDSVEDRVEVAGRTPFEQTLRAGRLRHLAAMGLAHHESRGRWRLDPDLAATLKRMGERGDIIRTMQRAVSAAALGRPPSEWVTDPDPSGERVLVGRVAGRGLADEHADRRYWLIDAVDGRLHYVEIGDAGAAAPIPDDAIVRIERRQAAIRAADRTLAEVAAANGGVYAVDAHLRADPRASERFAQAHVRRLEAIRRTVGGVERRADGSWVIGTDHLERAEAYERARLVRYPIEIELVSPLPLAQLVDAEAATWLDREVTSASPVPLRDGGFGAEVRKAQEQRRRWLIAQKLLGADQEAGSYPPGLVRTLERRDLARAAAILSRELALPFAEAGDGGRIEGVLNRRVDLASGRFALIERARDFTLVPWRPVLETRIGKPVAGIVPGDGTAWMFGRGRQGPSIE